MMTKRKLQRFEIESAPGSLTEFSAYNTDTIPAVVPPEIKKLFKDINLQTKQIGTTKPYTEDMYIEFDEVHRRSLDGVKSGDPATMTIEWMDIFDEPFIVDRVEGLRVYLRRK